jgi:hypothetical protein
MPLKGTQTLSVLRKKHLVNLGNIRLGITPPLSLDSTRATLLESVINTMLVTLDCNNIGCMGRCNPTTHLWQEGEYTPANEAATQNIISAISQLLADNQSNPSRRRGIQQETLEDRLKVAKEACAALNVDPMLLNQHQPEPQVEQQQQHQQPQQQEEPAQQPNLLDPGTTTIPRQTSKPVTGLSSEETLLRIICLQQEQNAVMADRQDRQHERLLTLLESRRLHNPVQTMTVTTVTQSCEPATGNIFVIPPRNIDNLAIAGVSLPLTFRLDGGSTTLDLEATSGDIVEEDHHQHGDHNGRCGKRPLEVSDYGSSPLLPLDEELEENKRLNKYIRRNNFVKTKTGIPIKWFLINRVCINFNINACKQVANHLNNSKKMVLRHICGSCLLHRRQIDSTHTAVSCRFRPQGFC